MKLTLTPDQQAFVRRKVEAGDFSREEQVVEQALQLWMEEESMAESPHYQAYVRAAIEEGEAAVARGDVAPFDGRAILEKAHREHREGVDGNHKSVGPR